MVCQLAGRLNGLKKLQQADFRSKLAVTTAVIQSKIQYLLPLYGGAPKYLMEAVQVQQLKAARFICGYKSYYWSSQKLLTTCRWLSVKQQEFYSTSLLAHKISISNRPQNIKGEIFQSYSVNTRAAAQGNIRYGENFRGDSELTRSSFKYRAMKYYNSLPVDMKKKKLPAFKVSLKKHAAQNIPLR